MFLEKVAVSTSNASTSTTATALFGARAMRADWWDVPYWREL